MRAKSSMAKPCNTPRPPTSTIDSLGLPSRPARPLFWTKSRSCAIHVDHTANVRKVNAQAERIGSDYNPSWAAQEVFQHAASLAYLAMVGDATQSDGHLLRPCDGVTVDDDFPRFRTVGACFLDQSLDLTIGLVAAHVIVLHPVESRNTETSSRGKLRAPNSSSSSDGGKVAVRYAVLHIGPAMDCLAVHFDGQGPTDVSTFSAIIVCKIAG